MKLFISYLRLNFGLHPHVSRTIRLGARLGCGVALELRVELGIGLTEVKS